MSCRRGEEAEEVAGVPAGLAGATAAEVPAARREVEREAPGMAALAVVRAPTVDSAPASPPEATRATLGMSGREAPDPRIPRVVRVRLASAWRRRNRGPGMRSGGAPVTER
jgi:hypothetical protein